VPSALDADKIVGEQKTEKPSTPKIRVGPAGWSYKDWIGIVYPILEKIASSRSTTSSLF
jgi:hypothetical protein